MPVHVLWVDIEQKHLDRIARVWTWICIILQGSVFALIVITYCMFGLVVFSDNSVLTPLFYINGDG